MISTSYLLLHLGVRPHAEKYLSSRNYGVARREAIEAKTKAIDALRVSEASKESKD